MRFSLRRLAGLSMLTLVATLACHRFGLDRYGEKETPSRIHDGNTIAIVLAANNTNISYSRLVPSRARSAEVKAFAERMTTDHTLLNTRVMDVAQRENISLADCDISREYRDASADERDVLREFEGARFDSAYIANEVRFHTNLLAIIDTVLFPSAKKPELREFVTNLRPTISAHLAHAEQVRASLAAKK
jgi:putative membrane protein